MSGNTRSSIRTSESSGRAEQVKDLERYPRVLIVSNRLPAMLRVKEGEPSLAPAAGGLATAMGTVHDQGRHLWIGSLGESSRLTPTQRAEIDSRLAARRLRDVGLSAQQVRAYYEEFSNGVLWPLFHYMPDRIPLDSRGWQTYREVNVRFADVVAGEHRPGDVIWVHDYQLLLLPGLLRERLPSARIGFFLHIPFPSFEVFRTLPWRTALVHGMLGADLIGFHTESYVRYFTHALRYALHLQPGEHSVRVGPRTVRLRAFPLGIDAAAYDRFAADPAVEKERSKIREGTGGRQLIVGVDRLDYTKGIPRRLLAFERMLEREGSARDCVRLIQVAVPSRSAVETYKSFRKQLDELVGRINGRFGTAASVPIHYLYRAVTPSQLVGLYRAADVMAVTPLRDGMNLVAKEFIASRTDEDGVLLLSEFAGAAEELGEAIQVNPYDIDAVADAMTAALRMAPEERRTRMRALRERVHAQTVQRWAETFLDELTHTTEAGRAHSAADHSSTAPQSRSDAL
jgi:trehalose 6-phosphate synthase/phosphatase